MEERLHSEGQKCFTNEGHTPDIPSRHPSRPPSRNESADFKILVSFKTTEMGCQKDLLLDCLKPLFVLPSHTAPAHLAECLPFKLGIYDNLGYGLSADILSRQASNVLVYAMVQLVLHQSI